MAAMKNGASKGSKKGHKGGKKGHKGGK